LRSEDRRDRMGRIPKKSNRRRHSSRPPPDSILQILFILSFACCDYKSEGATAVP